jgi:hypothetical protein
MYINTDWREVKREGNGVANGFNHPPDYALWWFDPAEADNIIKQMADAGLAYKITGSSEELSGSSVLTDF